MLEGFALSPELLQQLQADLVPIAIYGIFIVFYGIIIWKFYDSLAQRDLFREELEEGKSFGARLRNFFRRTHVLLDYLVVFPIVSIFWFAVLSLFIILLAKTRPVESILTISVAIIFATRVAAYYSEDLARDLAKLIPLGLLGVFIADSAYFSIELAFQRILSLQSHLVLVAEAIVLIVLLEWVLRVLYKIKVLLLGSSEAEAVQ